MQLICLLFVSKILLIKKYAPINLLTHVSTILTDVDHDVIIPRFYRGTLNAWASWLPISLRLKQAVPNHLVPDDLGRLCISCVI